MLPALLPKSLSQPIAQLAASAGPTTASFHVQGRGRSPAAGSARNRPIAAVSNVAARPYGQRVVAGRVSSPSLVTAGPVSSE
jgi:hypothetical protein